MIVLKKISVSEIESLVRLSFTGDEDLIFKYHICETGLDDCVSDTVKRIKEMAKLQKLDYYKVVYDKKPIGFAVMCYKRLYSFGISIYFRKSEVLKDYWQQIKGKLGNEFLCSLNAKNERGIKFLKKNGMKVGEIDKKNNIVTLVNI